MNEHSGPDIPRWAAALALFVLLGAAGLMWSGVIGAAPPREDIAALEPAHYDTSTVRKVRKDMTFDGAPCQSCHEGTEPMQGDPKEKGIFHEKIKLQHGRNQHCFNCHHRVQPANFSNFDGAQIKLASIELLCARCHGTTYRDWNSGAHGRRGGSWDLAQGGPKQTVCIACHDPHWPIFKEIEAAPAPHVNPRASKGSHPAAAGGHE